MHGTLREECSLLVDVTVTDDCLFVRLLSTKDKSSGREDFISALSIAEPKGGWIGYATL